MTPATKEPNQTWTHWIFDLDGTLTHAIHDFDAIREELGLAPGEPILESLAQLPAAEAEPLHRRLKELEWELAKQAKAHEGAHTLLLALQERQCQVGILTRNNRANAIESLRACELLEFFSQDSILGRNDAHPKPSPEGIMQLLEQWGATPSNAVIIGDYKFDLQAGINAGTDTVYADFADSGEWTSLATITIQSLEELLPSIPSQASMDACADKVPNKKRVDASEDKEADAADAADAAHTHPPLQRSLPKTTQEKETDNLGVVAIEYDAPPEGGLARLSELGFEALVKHLQTSQSLSPAQTQETSEEIAALAPALAEVLHPILASLSTLQARVEQLETQLASHNQSGVFAEDGEGNTNSIRTATPAASQASTDLVFPDTTVTPEKPETAEALEAAETSETHDVEDKSDVQTATATAETSASSGMRDFSQYETEGVNESEYEGYAPTNHPAPLLEAFDTPGAQPGQRAGVILLLIGLVFLLMVCAKFLWPQASQPGAKGNTKNVLPRTHLSTAQRRGPLPSPRQSQPARARKSAPTANAPKPHLAAQPAPRVGEPPIPAKRLQSKNPRSKRRYRRRRKKRFSLPKISAKLPLAKRCDICTKKLYLLLQDKVSKQQTKDFFAHCNALCNQSWFLFRKRFYHWCSFTKLGQNQYCPQELKQYQSAYNQQTWLNQ